METRILIELLAIKLYEHAWDNFPHKGAGEPWLKMSEEDREQFREMARSGKYGEEEES